MTKLVPATRRRPPGEPGFDALLPLTRRQLMVRSAVAMAGATASGALWAPSAGAQVALPGPEQVSGRLATSWFDLSLDLVRTTPGYSPPVASRSFAYAGLTLFAAVAPGLSGFRAPAGPLAGVAGLAPTDRRVAFDWPTVANAALARILHLLFSTAPPEQLAAVDALEERHARAARRSLPSDVFDRSVRSGRELAGLIFEWSRGDGGHEGYLRNFPPYNPPTGPDTWVPTPPGFQPALQPYWGSNRTFVLRSGADCPPGDHPLYSEAEGSTFYAEAFEVYRTVNNLTPEQEAIARFWSDDPGLTPTPPGHSISIATQVLQRERSTLATAAETYARVGVALSDAFVSCWYYKYLYNLLRPVTYIRRRIDSDWLPLLVTPPFPEYTSGHSAQSAAAAQVLTDLFGDGYAFVDHTHDDRGLPPRRFRSFFAAAAEAAISRLYGGIHYRAAIENGMEQGKCVGQAVSAVQYR